MQKFLSWLKDFLFKDDIGINRTIACVYAFVLLVSCWVGSLVGTLLMMFFSFINAIEYHALVTKPVAQTHVIVIRSDTDEDEEEENA